MNKNRLYNILFPAWLFYLLPTPVWLIILPANLLIDSLVLIFVSGKIGLNKKELWKQSILKVWAIGFISDILGALLILAVAFLADKICPNWNTFYFPGATIIAMPGVFISAVCIYYLNKRFSFEKSNLDDDTKIRLCKALAIITAPYAMLIPLYG